jgi:hypothetical protein
MSAWYPRTAEEVMALPERPSQYMQIDCPKCHTTINLHKQPRFERQATEEDAAMFVTSGHQTWMPVEIDGVWYRKEFNGP